MCTANISTNSPDQRHTVPAEPSTLICLVWAPCVLLWDILMVLGNLNMHGDTCLAATLL